MILDFFYIDSDMDDDSDSESEVTKQRTQEKPSVQPEQDNDDNTANELDQIQLKPTDYTWLKESFDARS